MLLSVALYGLYLTLIHYGLDQQAALVTIGGITLVIIIIFGAAAMARWRELKELPHIFSDAPLPGHIGRIADAFVHGFLSDRRDR
jgi:hypothetical protein